MLMLLLEFSNKYKIKMIILMILEHIKLKSEFLKMIIQAPHVFTNDF
jgi:hypothetical protein